MRKAVVVITLLLGLSKLCVKDIIALREELEYTISEYSEVLVQELALREELDFQKESNNQFISLLLNIQRKRRELDADKKKGVRASPKKLAITDDKCSSSPSGTVSHYHDHHPLYSLSESSSVLFSN